MSGGTVAELLAALRSVGECRALGVLERALHHLDRQETKAASEMRGEQVLIIT